jgi:hypothetical protein
VGANRYGNLTEEILNFLPDTPLTIADLCSKDSDAAIRLWQLSRAYGQIASEAFKEACLIKYADMYQCATCGEWKHVESMLRPHGNSDDLCCDEGCCEAWGDRS